MNAQLLAGAGQRADALCVDVTWQPHLSLYLYNIHAPAQCMTNHQLLEFYSRPNTTSGTLSVSPVADACWQGLGFDALVESSGTGNCEVPTSTGQ